MSKTRDTGYLANVIQVHDTGVRIMSGSTMLMAISSSGAVTITGEMSGSDAANALLLSGTGSVGFTTTSSFLAVSSSQQQISSSLLQVSASYISLSGSYNTFSGSASTRITENSSSIQQVSSSQQQISSSLLNVISIFATTGSNSFRATQSITGSLTVTGQIIAQTLNVQQVTSSIVFSSGSNTFGCDLNNRQTFTGSVLMTGSLIVNTTGPELQVNNNGVVLGNLLTDNHSITGSLRVTGSIASFSTCVGIGVSQPSSPLSIGGTFNGNTPFICMTGTGTGVYQRVIAAINPGMNAGDDLTIQMGTALCYRNVGQLNYHHEGSGCATNRMSIGLYGVDDVLNVTGNGFVGVGTCTPGTALEVSSRAADADRTLPHNVLTITAIQGQAPYSFFGGSILFKNTSYVSGVVCSARIRSVIYDDGAPNNCGGGIWLETTPTPGGTLTPSLKINYAGVACFASNVCGLSFLASSNVQASGATSCVIINRTDGTPAVLQLGNAQNSYQIQFTCTGGQRLAFLNGGPSEFASFYGTGVSVFTGQTCINGSGAGLQFTGGNNRIYFGACRAIEGNTSGTTLQIGENYDKTQIQSSAQMYNGSNGNSPKLYFGAEGNETAGAKAIYLETFWMIIQPHVNEGLRFRAVNASGTQYTIAKMYGTGTFSLDQYSNGTLSVSGGVVVSSSDKCMKIDDGGIDIALPKIMRLNPRYFYWKPETCLNSCDRQLGFYAQDVSEILGTEVANQSHNCSWGIYDRGIIAMLTKGMQEQQCKIALLESCLGIA